ncbi:MAG: hypothetical protein M1488_09095 [Gammaproteobacteria bacterium]|jgi:hypothetical protein|nr:hypothetical protein [Gammaproteobacteria bacterium]
MKKTTISRMAILAACTSMGLWGMTASATDMGWNGKVEAPRYQEQVFPPFPPVSCRAADF